MSFDNPSQDPEELNTITILFKQVTMIIELQSISVKVGVHSPIFWDAFKKQEKYLKHDPEAPMICPGFFWKNVFEQKALASTGATFWIQVEESNMIKNCFDATEVTKAGEGMIRGKILNITSTDPEAH